MTASPSPALARRLRACAPASEATLEALFEAVEIDDIVDPVVSLPDPIPMDYDRQRMEAGFGLCLQFWHRWADREALFATLAQDVLVAIERQQRLLPSRPPSGESIDAWVEGWASMIETHGSVLYVWQHEVDAPALGPLADRRDQVLDGIVDRLLALAADPPDGREPMSVALRAVLTDVPYVLSTQLAILPRAAASGFVAVMGVSFCLPHHIKISLCDCNDAMRQRKGAPEGARSSCRQMGAGVRRPRIRARSRSPWRR